MESRLNINVSAIDYDKTSKALTQQLILLEEMVHGKDDFVMTDSEFAFGWHFLNHQELKHRQTKQDIHRHIKR